MKFTILKRLLFGYVAIMLLIMFMGGYIAFNLNQLNKIIHGIASADVTTVRHLEHMLNILLSQIQFAKKYLILKDSDFYEQFDETSQRFQENFEQVEPLLDLAEERELLIEIKKIYSNYLTLFEKEVLLIDNGKIYPQEEYEEERNLLTDGIEVILREVIAKEKMDRDGKLELSNQLSLRILRVSTTAAVLIVILGFMISFITTRSINRSIKLLKGKTKEIAKERFIEITDITSPPEIKELADDFNIMSKRLHELDEMKMDFISHVSHELRTPLTAIKEASNMCLDTNINISQENKYELLKIIKEECERLIAAVNEILDLSRMEAGMMDYQLKKCSLDSILQKTVLKLAPIAQNKKIGLELRPIPQLPMVYIDEERIGCVLENVLSNALKFTPEEGNVIIATDSMNNNNSHIMISISDTGIGISKENQEKIFQKFTRIDQPEITTRGTGLGLSIARHIISDHGGKIWVESEPGKGSIFFFTLPVS